VGRGGVRSARGRCHHKHHIIITAAGAAGRAARCGAGHDRPLAPKWDQCDVIRALPLSEGRKDPALRQVRTSQSAISVTRSPPAAVRDLRVLRLADHAACLARPSLDRSPHGTRLLAGQHAVEGFGCTVGDESTMYRMHTFIDGM
jgi:hypothetical protein